ncbi:MAG: LytTR family DNA-binding domain-containing protein, partial [Pseudodesulfovibrio sp.]
LMRERHGGDAPPPPAPEPPAINRLTVEARGRVQLMDLADIVYCEKLDKRIIAYTVNESFPVHGLPSIEDMEERLMGKFFFRINRGTIVNLHRLREFSPWEGGRYCLVMDDENGTELTLSRGRVKDFKKQLGL